MTDNKGGDVRFWHSQFSQKKEEKRPTMSQGKTAARPNRFWSWVSSWKGEKAGS